MSDAAPDTTLLLDRWHEGDRDALQQLLEEHLPWIRERVHQRLGGVLRQRAETGDYVQDALVEFLEFGPRFQLSSGRAFRAMMATIAERTLCDRYQWWRAQRRDIARERAIDTAVLQLDPLQARGPTPSQAATVSEQRAWIELGLETLRPQERDVLVLRRLKELSFAEVATHLGLEEATARKRYERALVALSRAVASLQRGKIEAAFAEGES